MQDQKQQGSSLLFYKVFRSTADDASLNSATFISLHLYGCSELIFSRCQFASAPHHSSAHVAVDEVLPADLFAVVSEVEVEQSRTESGHGDRQVTEILLIPGEVTLRGSRHTAERYV